MYTCTRVKTRGMCLSPVMDDDSMWKRYQNRVILNIRRSCLRSSPSDVSPPNPLWSSVGCNAKYPLFSCQSDCKKRGRGLGNLVPVNAEHFRHPILQRHWNSCAVVGSSGRLLKTEYGRHIDDHEIVARINYPPIKGYEKHVGSRPSDIHFFGDKVDRCFNEIHPETKLMVFPLPYDSNRRDVSFRSCDSNRKLPLYSISNYIMNFARTLIYNYSLAHRPANVKADKVINKMASSGFRSVVFAMMLCNHVDVYGFGLSGDKEEPVHYFEKSRNHQLFFMYHYPNYEFELLSHWPNATSSDFYPGFGKVRVFT
ncbi:CMP-N-acetylneuraminate-beta-galactosamide-alpha-2,3-sialyltransferase 1-like [Corticium candelabrum]|uniref:CMP-N-acetylneuraminate-beta-galactosamide- alpha-2,3-sialyltransferase 1-like n=1 Tax=Corticium candelabrum TaxID=121492 RepID=UPI002E25DE41|nr:CMP-N-acetylneuraminate-beta-galactosamide-alpha-2,3-sialyltransferase 1-like [Corticium candelabrum]